MGNIFLEMNGCIAEFPKLSDTLANGKGTLQGAVEKTADPRSFRDDSLLVQPKGMSESVHRVWATVT